MFKTLLTTGKPMQILQWIATNWQDLCKWAGGFYILYQIGRMFVGAVSSSNRIVSRFEKVEVSLGTVETLVTALSTNHLPHMQQALEENNALLKETNTTLSGMREDLRIVLLKEVVR